MLLGLLCYLTISQMIDKHFKDYILYASDTKSDTNTQQPLMLFKSIKCLNFFNHGGIMGFLFFIYLLIIIIKNIQN